MAGTAETAPAKRRHAGRLGAALFAAVVACALLAPARAAQAPLRAEVSTSAENGFVRLVFKFAAETEPEVRLSNNILVVSFTQPVDINVDHIAVNAPGTISVARRDPDGSAVRMALARKVAVNTMAAGERFYVDLLPDTWKGVKPGLPQEVVDELARRAREAEKQLRKQQRAEQQQRLATVRVRTTRLPTLTRFLFDVPDVVAVSADRNGDTLKLLFSLPLKFDLAEVKAALPPSVGAIEAETGEEGSTVRLTLIGKAEARTFREDRTFAVDVAMAPQEAAQPSTALPGSEAAKNGAAGAATSAPPAQPAGEPKAAPPKSGQPSTRPKPVAAVEPPARGDDERPAPIAAASSTPAALIVVREAAAAPERPANEASRLAAIATLPAAPATPPAAMPAPEQRDLSAAPNARVTVSSKRNGDTLRLFLPFAAPTPAAIFRRADTVWIVVDTQAPLDISRLKDETQGVIRAATLRRQADAQIIRLKLDRPYLSSVTSDGDGWVVTLGDAVVAPTTPLGVVREVNPASQTIAVVPFDEGHRLHRLSDPEAGDDLLVVTGVAPVRGFLRPHEFIEFRLLPSTHGIVLQTVADDVLVHLAADRVIVSRPGGLNLTAVGARGSPELSLTSTRPVALDAQSWKADRSQPFRERQTALINTAADAAEGKRTPARLDLARFYLAREHFAEAKGVLDFALANERDHDEVAAALVLRGVANLMLGRDDAALKDFSNPAVGNLYDAPLWRSVALSRQGRWSEARTGFRNIETTSAGLPLELQRFAVSEALRCALELGDFGEASRRLNDFEAVGTTPEIRPILAVMSGRLAEGVGRAGDALAQYAIAAESPVAPVAVQGRLRRILLRFALREVERADVIAELEAIVAAWRGDATELEALQALARLYTDEKRYRPAFDIMRIAVAVFGRSEVARRIQEDAAATFESLFLTDRGNAFSPIEALGVFYDYHALTPPGRRGDEMIRRLADRLIAVDLLPQAGELLQHQIDHRLQGVARAQVASRLAMIYLSDRKPDRALQALRNTRAAEMPNDLRTHRLLLEARALSETGRHDLALEVAQEIAVAEAERLRADILWSARRWRDAAEQIEIMLGERWRNFAPLTMVERSDILRGAVGYALAEDVLGLDRFRQKYAAKIAETPDARMFDVVTTPVGARAEEFVEAAKAASSVDTLSAFLSDLRARFPDAGETQTPAEAPRS